MPDDQIVPISRTLAEPMEALFKVGGFALAFGFAGLVLMIVAMFTPGTLQIPLFVMGSVLTLLCLAFFLYTNLRTRTVAQSVRDDLPLLDALQRSAMHAAELALVTQSFAFKYRTKIQEAIETVTPMLKSIPLLGPKLLDLTESAKFSSALVDATDGTRKTIEQLHEAIRKGNLREIKKYGRQLEDAIDVLKTALKQT